MAGEYHGPVWLRPRFVTTCLGGPPGPATRSRLWWDLTHACLIAPLTGYLRLAIDASALAPAQEERI